MSDDGLPKPIYPNHWKGKNGLYCVGLSRRGFMELALILKTQLMISSPLCNVSKKGGGEREREREREREDTVVI